MWKLFLYFLLLIISSYILFIIINLFLPDGGDAYGSLLMIVIIQLCLIISIQIYSLKIKTNKD